MHRFPEPFVANVLSYGGEVGARWLRHLPSLVAAGAERWGLVAPEPIARLSFNYLLRARLDAPRGRLRTAVAKFIWEQDALAYEVTWLRTQQGNGAVRLLDVCEGLGAYLMEELNPAEPVPTHDDESATEIIARLIAVLGERTTDVTLPRVATWFDDLRHYGTSPPPGIDQAVVQRARGVACELSLPVRDERLLHGDLHHDNVLSAAGEWKVIDAKGVVGDPAHECAAMLRNRLGAVNAGDLPKVLRARLAILSAVTGFDAKRIAGWGVAQTVLSCCWSAAASQLRDVDRHLAVAAALNSMA